MRNATNYALFSILFFLSLTHTINAIPIGPDKYYINPTNQNELEQILYIYGREDLSTEQDLYFSVVGMRKIGDEHEREFYRPNPNDESETANWINLGITQARILPGETITIPWTLDIGDYSGCGTKLAGIMISNSPEAEFERETAIQIQKEIISQIHIDIPGTNNEECLTLLEANKFGVDRFFKIFNYHNIPFKTVISNSGNYLSQSPKGFIEIFGLGDKITIEFNNENLDIYPGSERKFQNIWIDPEYPEDGSFFEKLIYETTHLRIGRYEARLGITKNVEQSIVAYDHFWIIPWRVVSVLLLTILTSILLGRIFRSKTTKDTKD
jgi:hypothetical protein